MAKKVKKRIVRREYTRADVRELRDHSKARTPVAKIAKQMRRTEASLRQKALTLGIPLGHRRRSAVRSGRRTGRKTG
jgi:isocitrate lyase